MLLLNAIDLESETSLLWGGIPLKERRNGLHVREDSRMRVILWLILEISTEIIFVLELQVTQRHILKLRVQRRIFKTLNTKLTVEQTWSLLSFFMITKSTFHLSKNVETLAFKFQSSLVSCQFRITRALNAWFSFVRLMLQMMFWEVLNLLKTMMLQ